MMMVLAAFVVGIVYELGFNTTDAFAALVVVALLALAAGLLALIWVADFVVARSLVERRRLAKLS